MRENISKSRQRVVNLTILVLLYTICYNTITAQAVDAKVERTSVKTALLSSYSFTFVGHELDLEYLWFNKKENALSVGLNFHMNFLPRDNQRVQYFHYAHPIEAIGVSFSHYLLLKKLKTPEGFSPYLIQSARLSYLQEMIFLNFDHDPHKELRPGNKGPILELLGGIGFMTKITDRLYLDENASIGVYMTYPTHRKTDNLRHFFKASQFEFNLQFQIGLVYALK